MFVDVEFLQKKVVECRISGQNCCRFVDSLVRCRCRICVFMNVEINFTKIAVNVVEFEHIKL